MNRKGQTMKKRNLLKIFSIIFVAVILLTFVLPGQVQIWSAVVGNRTHKDVDGAAYEILSQDPALKNVKFPSLSDVPPSKLGGFTGKGASPPNLRTGPLSSPQQAEGYPAVV
jgi:cytoskeletal protein RodZ